MSAAPRLRQAGEAPPLPAGPVWTGARDRKGFGGRYHTAPDCWALTAPKRRRAWADAPAAIADRWYACPYCAAPPPCCATGQHAVIALPRWAAADRPEWEDELIGSEASDA